MRTGRDVAASHIVVTTGVAARLQIGGLLFGLLPRRLRMMFAPLHRARRIANCLIEKTPVKYALPRFRTSLLERSLVRWFVTRHIALGDCSDMAWPIKLPKMNVRSASLNKYGGEASRERSVACRATTESTIRTPAMPRPAAGTVSWAAEERRKDSSAQAAIATAVIFWPKSRRDKEELSAECEVRSWIRRSSTPLSSCPVTDLNTSIAPTECDEP